MSSIDPGLHYPLDLEALPDSWEAVYVGDVATEIRSGFASGKHNQDGTGIPHFRPMNVSREGEIDLGVVKYVDPEKDPRRLSKGDVLFNNTNSAELIGKTALVKQDEDWAYSNHMTRVRFPESIDSAFAAHQLHFLWMQGYFLHNCVKHVNQASISAKALSSTIPLVVAPLPEQRRIVARIEELFSRLDAGVAALHHAKAQLQRYRQSVLTAAVTGQLTQAWRKKHPDTEPAEKLLERILEQRRENWSGRGKYKEPCSPETTDLPELPPYWTWASLPQLGELNRGKSKHRPRNAEFLYGGPYPFVQTGDVRHANGTIQDYSQTYSEEGLKQSRLWPRGTLCITIAANIAESAILGFDACFPDSIVGFIPTGGELDVRYYEFFIQTAREDLDRYAPATAQKNINLKILSEVAVPLPPLAEQLQIVAEVESRTTVIDHLEAELDTQVIRSTKLRQSILSSAFNGCLVPRDPDDEPAGILLGRIKAKKKQFIRMGNSHFAQPSRRKKMKKSNQLISLEELKQDFLASLMEELSKETISPEVLWRESGLSIDLFYAALKREVEAGRVREAKGRKLELVS